MIYSVPKPILVARENFAVNNNLSGNFYIYFFTYAFHGDQRLFGTISSVSNLNWKPSPSSSFTIYPTLIPQHRSRHARGTALNDYENYQTIPFRRYFVTTRNFSVVLHISKGEITNVLHDYCVEIIFRIPKNAKNISRHQKRRFLRYLSSGILGSRDFQGDLNLPIKIFLYKKFCGRLLTFHILRLWRHLSSHQSKVHNILNNISGMWLKAINYR